jgi:hypothetical protein
MPRRKATPVASPLVDKNMLTMSNGRTIAYFLRNTETAESLKALDLAELNELCALLDGLWTEFQRRGLGLRPYDYLQRDKEYLINRAARELNSLRCIIEYGQDVLGERIDELEERVPKGPVLTINLETVSYEQALELVRGTYQVGEQTEEDTSSALVESASQVSFLQQDITAHKEWRTKAKTALQALVELIGPYPDAQNYLTDVLAAAPTEES